jgi:serine/threonine-protein kinase
VKIADFGIAKIAGTNLTQTGLAMGTPAFMSPEQVSMSPVDARSDLFSLGGVLYWMFTGEKPFPGESLTQITFKVVFGSPLPVAFLNPKLPAALDVVLSRCLAKNPNDRYATGRELAADLELVRAGKALHTTLAPVSDITLMQSNPLPVVAAGLPAEQRMPQTPLPVFTDTTVRVGSQTGHVRAEAAPRVTSPKRDTMPIAPPAAGTKKSNTPLLGGAAILVVLVVAGYFVMQRKPAAPSPQPTAPAVEQAAPAQATAAQANVPPPPPDPSKSLAAGGAQPADLSSAPMAAPAKSEESKAATKKATVTGKATLQIDCRNNFDEAKLIIKVDGKEILSESMVNKKPLTVVRPVNAGEHKVVVQVISEKAKFDQKQTIAGEFKADGTRVLVIDFGRGSGLGLRKPKLSLKWGS